MMSTEYVVRLAGAEHVDRLPDIEREAATRFGDTLPESVFSHVTPQDALAEAQHAGLLWVALEPAGAPVGFAVASILGRRAHLDELDVLPGYGRRGIGTALVEAVEDHALSSGCVEITLTTFRDVPWNAPFYARRGFEVIPEQDLGADLARRLSDEVAMGLERSSRVAMLKRLSRPTSGSTPKRRPVG
ncbi:MAG: GNAT family N-acetyltransferase [Coriobacteriia bacterium]|nr:GNAT family N-acetyltransferase [Coriobacteriia bacterium]